MLTEGMVLLVWVQVWPTALANHQQQVPADPERHRLARALPWYLAVAGTCCGLFLPPHRPCGPAVQHMMVLLCLGGHSAALPAQASTSQSHGLHSFVHSFHPQDVMAYLRLAVSLQDNVALGRIINTPRRGLGDTSIEKLHAAAVARGLNLSAFLFGDAATGGGSAGLPPLPDRAELGLTAKAAAALEAFRELMLGLHGAVASQPLGRALQAIIDKVRCSVGSAELSSALCVASHLVPACRGCSHTGLHRSGADCEVGRNVPTTSFCLLCHPFLTSPCHAPHSWPQTGYEKHVRDGGCSSSGKEGDEEERLQRLAQLVRWRCPACFGDTAGTGCCQLIQLPSRGSGNVPVNVSPRQCPS